MVASPSDRAADQRAAPDVSSSPADASGRLFTAQFAALTVVAGLYFGANGVLNALMPTFVVDAIGGTEATAGAVMGALAFTALASRPFHGRHADRRGARQLLVWGPIVSTLSMLLLILLPPSLPAAYLSRLVLGAGIAAMFTGTTMLALQLAPENRQSQGASFMLISVHVGLGLGPLLGLRVLERFDYREVWVAVAVLMLASSAVARFLQQRPPTRAAGSEPAPLVHRAALVPGIVTFFGVFGFNGFLTFASLYGREVGVADVALIFTVLSGTIVVVRLLFGWVPDVVGPIRAGSGALIVTVIAALTVAWWSTPTGVFVGAVLLALGLSLQSPSFIPLAILGVPDHERGAATATFTAFYDIANALVGPLLGLIVTGVGYSAAFSFTAVMAVIAFVLLHLLVAPRWRALHTA